MKILRFAMLVAGFLFVPAIAEAQTTLTACYVPKTGTVYRIKVEGSPIKCSPNHVEFSWTTQNTTQFIKRMGSTENIGTTHETITAECEVGETAVSGGYSAYQSLVFQNPANVLVSSSLTGIAFNGWSVTLGSADGFVFYGTAWVLCAKSGP